MMAVMRVGVYILSEKMCNKVEENGESVVTVCRENVRVALVYFPKNMNAFYEGSEQVRVCMERGGGRWCKRGDGL